MTNWETQIHKGVLELCLLNALRGGPMHGYDLADLMRQYRGIIVSGGTVYRMLRRLKDERLVTVSVAASRTGPPRKVYAMTDAGERMRRRMVRFWRTVNDSVHAIGGVTAR